MMMTYYVCDPAGAPCPNATLTYPSTSGAGGLSGSVLSVLVAVVVSVVLTLSSVL
jgi:hypothetical protein